MGSERRIVSVQGHFVSGREAGTAVVGSAKHIFSFQDCEIDAKQESL